MSLTHASWFSGVGGLDMGLEAAGWETVSFSEIDPYASAALAHRWPGVPNLGSITDVAGDPFRRDVGTGRDGEREFARRWHGSASGRHDVQPHGDSDTWHRAFLWTGGFPCQDLSVAGKRRGIVEGSRSGLALTFLDLVERHRPPAIILENVPGLLSSHAGRDFGALLRRLGELGYWWAYRILDARYFGVPQRRRRVFIVALHAGIGATADSPAEVLSVGSRCDRHPATGGQAGPGAADSPDDGADVVGTIPAGLGHHGNGGHSSQAVASGHVIPGIRPSPDPGGDGTTHGMARRVDDSPRLEDEGQEVDATDQASAAAILRGVWPHAGEEAVQRTARGLRGLPAAEVLRLSLYGEELRLASELGHLQHREDGELPRQEDDPAWAMLALLYAQGTRRPSPERGPGRQPDGEPDAPLSELPRHDPRLAQPEIAATLNSGGNNGGFRTEPGEHLVFTKHRAAGENDPSPESWGPAEVSGTLDAIGQVPRTRTYALGTPPGDSELLPDGLDSHRYRCCGNGVVAPVAEFIGERLRVLVEQLLAETAA